MRRIEGMLRCISFGVEMGVKNSCLLGFAVKSWLLELGHYRLDEIYEANTKESDVDSDQERSKVHQMLTQVCNA